MNVSKRGKRVFLMILNTMNMTHAGLLNKQMYFTKSVLFGLLCVMMACSSTLSAAEENKMDRFAGHRIELTQVVFLFDETLYQLTDPISSVVVAGDFNRFDPQGKEWQLNDDDHDHLWTLTASSGMVRYGQRFIFVINGTQWVSPAKGIDPKYLLESDGDGLFLVGGELENFLQPKLDALTYTDAQGHALPYRLLRPAHYDASKTYPLVVLLHGAGERGVNNATPIRVKNGAYEFITATQAHEYFMLIPQCPKGVTWSGLDWAKLPYVMHDAPTEPMRLTLELIEQLQKEFSIDPKRIYATGLSMGGMGTWDMVIRRPDLFAAAMPICGGFDPTKAAALKDIPCLVFHGSDDSVVPVAGSRNMANAVNAAGGTVEYIEYAGENHQVWERTYLNKKAIDWLFQQIKK